MRRVRVAVATAVGVAVLAGCSSGETANETLPSASSTAAETSEALPPLGPPDMPMPSEARQRTPEGVTSFVTYYLDLADFLLKDLESAPLRDLSKDCASCAQLADGYDADRAAGNRYEGGEISIKSMGTASVSARGGEVAYLLHQDAVRLYAPNGEPIPERSIEAVDLSGGITVEWDADRTTWLVTQLTAEPL